MRTAIHLADTPAERNAIFRLRYEIYVEEMRIFGSVANHNERIFIDEHDDHARLIYAMAGDEIVGSLRVNLGCDAPFSDEFEETYGLKRFRQAVSDEQIMVLTRFMVKEQYRGSALAFRMIAEAARIAVEENIQVAVCDCQPHLIRYYNRIGFQSYECPVYNDPEFGIMIPLVMLLPDAEYLREIRSPVRPMVAKLANPELAASLWQCIGKPAVDTLYDTQLQSDNAILNDLLHRHEQEEFTFFKGLSDAEVESVVRSGYIISCKAGDRVIRRGQLTNTVFVLLSGSLGLQDASGRLLAEALQGEVVGEMAFLLGTRRTADVLAGLEGARLLVLDERQLTRRLALASPTAPTLFKNLSRTLASRLTGMLIRIDQSQTGSSFAA